MSDSLLIKDFLQPLDLSAILGDDELNDGQLGRRMRSYTNAFPDFEGANIIIMGIAEERGTGNGISLGDAPTLIRKNLYRLYSWHPDVQLVDIGNINPGASLNDTYAAAKAVIAELIAAGKTVIILGGSHDLTLAQYGAYVQHEQIIEASCVDAFINLTIDTPLKSENFLMEMLTGEPKIGRAHV